MDELDEEGKEGKEGSEGKGKGKGQEEEDEEDEEVEEGGENQNGQEEEHEHGNTVDEGAADVVDTARMSTTPPANQLSIQTCSQSVDKSILSWVCTILQLLHQYHLMQLPGFIVPSECHQPAQF